jgi:arsenite methyltransferase
MAQGERLAIDAEQLREEVRRRYAAAARRVAEATPSRGGCGPAEPGAAATDTTGSCRTITAGIYSAEETQTLPEGALRASLGCGNPTALAQLRPGEVVLDLGSGGGADVLLSARRVGPTGFAYGLDMTDEMLALAEANRAAAGVEHVRFLKGTIEAIPLPDASIDVIISNCVINLAADKDAVLREAYRVLKPGGRFAVTDVVVLGDLPAPVRQSLEAWAGCIAGALPAGEYLAKLRAAGFEAPEVQVIRTYGPADLQEWTAGEVDTGAGCCTCCDLPAAGAGALASAFVRATKPVA